MPRVLVAVDATEGSTNAASVAHRLFGDGSEYLAVNVAPMTLGPAEMRTWPMAWSVTAPVPFGGVWPAAGPAAVSGDDDRSPRERAEVEATAAADESGIDAEPIGEAGDPADAILRAAGEHDVDVIVVGARDRGWLDRLLEPSVSKAVLDRASVPVLVVR